MEKRKFLRYTTEAAEKAPTWLLVVLGGLIYRQNPYRSMVPVGLVIVLVIGEASMFLVALDMLAKLKDELIIHRI